MPKAASTVYEVTVPSRGLKVARMNFTDSQMNKAKAGESNHQKGVAKAFRERIKKDYGYDPGFIEYRLMRFKALAAVPAQP